MSLPGEFIEKIRKYFPVWSEHILRGLSVRKKTTFRINRIKINRSEFVRRATSKGIKFQQVLWYNDAFVLNQPSQREFQESEFYKNGQVYLQNLSSMLPPLFMSLSKGNRILDLCAAPGSKTTQIASILGNDCELVAVEKIKPRFYRLKANLELQGVNCCRIHLMDGAGIGRLYPEYFDRILLDAPCSAEGRFKPGDPRSWAYWSQRKVKEMQHKQKRLISSAYYALRKGGKLVYSTCTFSPEENEFLIEWTLKKFSQLKLEKIRLPMKNIFPGINDIGWHVLPNEVMEGFYICVLTKRI